MIYVLALLATLSTIVLFFIIDRIKKFRQIVAKILVNLALIIALISIYLSWFFLFKWLI